MIVPSVKQRRAEDKMRAKLTALDRADGGDRVYQWTRKQHPDIRWSMDRLGHACDSLAAAITEVTSE